MHPGSAKQSKLELHLFYQKEGRMTTQKSPTSSSNLIEDTKVDVVLLTALLKTVSEHREELEWILQKQSQLRVEYLTFYKKDLSEIIAAISDQKIQQPEMEKMIAEINSTFRKDIEKSLAIVDVKYQESVKEQIIKMAAEDLRNSAMQHISEKNKLKPLVSDLHDFLNSLNFRGLENASSLNRRRTELISKLTEIVKTGK
jgi:hypothetical protein